MLGNSAIQVLRYYWEIELSPQIVIKKESIDELCGNNIVVDEEEGNSLYGGGPPYICTKMRYEQLKEQYAELRDILLKMLKEENVLVEDFLSMA